MTHQSRRLREWTERKTLGEVLGLPKVISVVVDSYLNDTKLSLLFRVPQKKYSVLGTRNSYYYQMTSALQYRVFWNHDQKLYAKRLLEEAHDALETSLFEEDSSDHNEIFVVWKRQFHQKKNQKRTKIFTLPIMDVVNIVPKNFLQMIV